MLSSDLPRVLLLLTAVELSWGSLSDEDERMILQMHNLYRSQVSPPAADMQKLVSVPWKLWGLPAPG